MDELAQPDWGQSYCAQCRKYHPDFVFLYPPFGLVKAAVRKAQHVRSQGVLAMAYTPSALWGPAILRPPSGSTPARSHPRLERCAAHVLNQYNPAGHYIPILHFDFWQYTSPRPLALACIHRDAHSHRRLRQGRSEHDAAEAAAILVSLPIHPCWHGLYQPVHYSKSHQWIGISR